MSTELTTTNIDSTSAILARVEADEKAFELAQRRAKVYAFSTLVPADYRGEEKIPNVLIAQNMADRLGADVLMVMQNLYIVHGRPGWSAQFLIATFNKTGDFSRIKYRFTGTQGEESWGCVAFAKESATDEVVEGPEVTLKIAKDEGWLLRNGSKWKTIPELMLRYRAATWLIRSTSPEIAMGLPTKEELWDREPVESAVIDAKSAEDLAARADVNDGPIIQTDVITQPPPAPETASSPESFPEPSAHAKAYAGRLAKISKRSTFEEISAEISQDDSLTDGDIRWLGLLMDEKKEAIDQAEKKS